MNIISLIKFGAKTHMESLYDKGLIYMNSLEVFKKTEDEELRGDRYEALYEQKEVNNIKISLGANKIGVAEKGVLRLWHENSQGNIYSMYALRMTEDLKDIRIDNNCKRFGDTCVFILDVNKFIDRVITTARKAGLEIIYAPVEYHETKSFQGKWSVFKKPLQYSYQNEFRFFIRRDESGPLSLEIGSLNDIAAIAESNKIQTLKVSRT